MSILGPFHILRSADITLQSATAPFWESRSIRTLPRQQFSTLQNSLFPIYFTLQSALPVVAALTYPGARTVLGTGPSSLAGVLLEENRLTVLLPLSIVFVSGLTNLLYLTPKVVGVIKQRWQQESIDGKKSYDPPPHSKEMTELNKKFAKLHGISTLVNLGGLLATVAYGVVLGRRLS
ncbi:hypothetical protein T310_7105 [Rasamsonia emersonii CBS 393.64]|uniref:TMEM205-like domain-containing protein n=1 Tax=Rasamsonia emersonii (strain ATCC 16479 / CBS 393.64 / IMI 116815) TaxID=1408163 RepID=A0A0F4YM47_RASE3|nr:hypothetical protein T310_7105 [Rasamsonia emersonii CBS 393.64]KKA18936.1 hypothetical protein T310_7105 [Rasamsonia emersonii CBS 393.64]